MTLRLQIPKQSRTTNHTLHHRHDYRNTRFFCLVTPDISSPGSSNAHGLLGHVIFRISELKRLYLPIPNGPASSTNLLTEEATLFLKPHNHCLYNLAMCNTTYLPDTELSLIHTEYKPEGLLFPRVNVVGFNSGCMHMYADLINLAFTETGHFGFCCFAPLLERTSTMWQDNIPSTDISHRQFINT
jgi:hypothetical protein